MASRLPTDNATGRQHTRPDARCMTCRKYYFPVWGKPALRAVVIVTPGPTLPGRMVGTEDEARAGTRGARSGAGGMYRMCYATLNRGRWPSDRSGAARAGAPANGRRKSHRAGPGCGASQRGPMRGRIRRWPEKLQKSVSRGGGSIPNPYRRERPLREISTSIHTTASRAMPA